jgi:DNA-binding transcriptional MerR regulator
MTLAELADAASVPARTVRFYIARGLVDGPEVAGRGAAYGPDHLERLRKIRRLQQGGLTLVAIARELETVAGTAPPVKEPAAWWHYQVSPDVTVLVRADAGPWRQKQVREALQQLTARLAEKEEG